MQNKPNFQNTKNAITSVITMTNNDEQRTMNYLKQTQSNPISVIAGQYIGFLGLVFIL